METPSKQGTCCAANRGGETGRLAHGLRRDHDPWVDVEFVRGEGARLWDDENRCWIDLTCGFGVSNFGYSYPPFCDIADQQARTLPQLTGQINALQRDLAELLCRHVGASIDDCRVALHSSGARALETAIQAAQVVRPGKVLSIWPGFHGNSTGTRPLSVPRIEPSYWPPGAEMLVPQSGNNDSLVPTSGGARPNCDIESWVNRLQTQLATYLHERADEISAIVIDPGFSTRGYFLPPARFGRWLRSATRQYGVLLIADEVQTGLGRCGDWLLSYRQEWAADLVVIGKSLGGGIFPIAATLGASSMFERLPMGVVRETFGGAHVGCRIAIEVIRRLADERKGIFSRAERIGYQLREAVAGQLATLGTGGSGVGLQPAISGIGAVCVIDMAGGEMDEQAVSPAAPHAARAFSLACRESLLRAHLSGPLRTRIVLLPPLTLSDAELAECLARVTGACQLFTRSMQQT